MATPPSVPKAPEQVSDWWQNHGYFIFVIVNLLAAMVQEWNREGVVIQSSIGAAICGILYALYKQNEHLHG